MLCGWIFTVSSDKGFEAVAKGSGEFFVLFTFISSYFFFYASSKFIVKPDTEEIEDRTSWFALFSANERKFGRSVFGLLASALNVGMMILFLLNKDLRFI